MDSIKPQKKIEDATVPEFEYVINELLFEYRVAKIVGYHKMDREYESGILNKWAAHIIDRPGRRWRMTCFNLNHSD